MNSFLNTRFQSHQSLLIATTFVTHFTVVKQNVSKGDGRMRIRARLVNGSLLEFAEYIELNDNDQIVEHVYSFHWQNGENQLIRRWDNVEHYSKLPYAPHHIHHTDGTISGNSELPTLALVLSVIEQHFQE